VATALEALGDDAGRVQRGELRLGVIVTIMAGCVAYSRRFYEEALRDPRTASPLIFPETVFNAPASHLAAYLGSPSINYSVVGDDGTFLQGLALAAQWLEQGQVDACVVVGTEELDWIVADAVRHFSRKSVHTAGAGAIYLKHHAPDARNETGDVAELAAVTDSFLFTRKQPRAEAARRMRAQLSPGNSDALFLSTQNIARLDAAENAAWSDWPGPRFAPKQVLGEAFNASAAWQCVAACDAVGSGRFPAAAASVVGANQQAIGARFVAVRQTTRT
jgi:3-oxoacyl-(acyl-carrier-protein) synthase